MPSKDEIENHPIFESPPITELAILIYFERYKVSLPEFGLFYEKIKEDFPKFTNGQPIYPVNLNQPLEEFFRVFYLSNDNVNLLQLQNDFFGFNWRKRDKKSYPQFRTFVDEHKKYYDIFKNYLAERGKTAPKINGGSLTYVNILNLSDIGVKLSELGKIFIGFNNPILETEPKNITYRMDFPMMKNEGNIQFTIQNNNAKRSSENQLLKFDFLATQNQAFEDEDEYWEWLDDANQSLTYYFTKMINPDIQKEVFKQK